jgi:2',3'-cyclic-nucleotide 2'-phosphodiesterase (5'-nucleotidase family)
MLTGQNPPPGVRTPKEVSLRAAALAEMQHTIGLDAMAVGERELALGLPELRRLAKANHLRLLSSNLLEAGGKLAFEAGYVAQAAGVKVGIFGLTDVQKPQSAPIDEARLTMGPTEDAARREVARLRAQGATLVVALAHVGAPAARALLSKVQGIDLCIVGHTSSPPAEPEKVGEGYLIEPYRQGKQLGEFMIHLLPGSTKLAAAGQMRAVRTQLEARKRDYERFARQLEKETVDRRRDTWKSSLERARAEMTRLCTSASATANASPASTEGSWFDHRLIPMDKSVADAPEIAQLIQKHKEALEKQRPKTAPAGKQTPDRTKAAVPAGKVRLTPPTASH